MTGSLRPDFLENFALHNTSYFQVQYLLSLDAFFLKNNLIFQLS